MSPSLFLIGPGFIGGEILDNLLQENKYRITVLVRRESHATELRKLGLDTVLGDIDDKALIAQQTARHDIVIHVATADHLPSVEAVIDGLTQRSNAGEKSIFIHTSGTSLIGDDAHGNFPSDAIFHDDTPDAIDALPDSAAHREIDLAIVRASKRLAPHATMAIMIPPLIYGVSAREQRMSIQLPTLVRYALKHGYAAHIGKGVSIWSHIHVSDLARGYVTLLHHLEQPGTIDEVIRNPYFFCENGAERSWGDCAVEIGKALHAAGRIASPEPRTIPRENYDDLFGPVYSGLVVGSNARSRADRLRALGWTPQAKGTYASLIEDEIPRILKETGPFNGYARAVASGSPLEK